MRIGNFIINRYRNSDNFMDEYYHNIYSKYQDFTMVPRANLISTLKLIKRHQISGAIVECGVWRGGMIASVGEIIGNKEEYFLFDSFEGLPVAKQIDGDAAVEWQNKKESQGYYDNCKADKEFAIQAMDLAGITNYHIVKGWFDETLNVYKNKIPPIGILILDGDWYESIKISLDVLYKMVVPKGLIIIDDYFLWDGCTKAVHEFINKFNPVQRIRSTEEGVCYIIKE